MAAQSHEVENLIVRMTGDARSYLNMAKEAQAATENVSRTVESSAGRIAIMSRRFNAFGLQLRGYGAAAAAAVIPLLGIGNITGSIFKGVKLAADAEQMELAFTTLVGSAELAKQTIGDLKKFAAETPFEMPEVVEAAKQMVAFGQDAESIVPTMRMLGDISSGLNIPLGQLTYLFGTLKSQGRAFTVDINQFAMRGVPIWAELGKQFGKTNAEVRKMVEQGLVSFADVERAFIAMTSAGGRFGGMMVHQSKTLGGLYSTMMDGINETLRKLGETIIEEFNLKGMTKDVAVLAEATAAWFTGLSSGAKSALAAVALATAAVGGLTLAFFVLKGVITLAFGGLNIALAAFVTVAASVIAGTAALVVSLGGIASTFEIIKQRAAEAWEWLKPIRQAIVSFFGAVMDLGTEALAWLTTKASEAWQAITGSASVNWQRVQEIIRDVILGAEFGLRNFGTIATHVWTGAKLRVVSFQETVKHFFTGVLPALLSWFGRNWTTVFSDALHNSMMLFKNHTSNVIAVFRNLPGLIEGTVSFKDIFTPLETGFRSTLKELPKIPPRELGALEASLRQLFEAQGRAITESWEEFRRRKLAEFGLSPEAVAEAARTAGKLGEALAAPIAAARKELERFDHALFGSAESRQRLREYTMLHKQLTTPSAAGGLNGRAPAMADAGGALAGGAALGILRNIEANTAVTAKKPGLDVKAADFF